MTPLLQKIILAEKNNWILWIPVIFGCGIIFYFHFPYTNYLATSIILIFCIYTSFYLKEHISSLISIAITIFLSAFLWSKIYVEKISYSPKLQQRIYAIAIAKIENIKSFDKSTSKILTLKDLQLYKSKYSKNDVKKTKRKTRKNKKFPEKDLLNLEGLQDIQRDSPKNYNFSSQIWDNNKLKNSPKKITILIRENTEVQIGDIIKVKVLLEPLKKQTIIGEYNFARHSYFKGIGAKGYAISKVKIIETNTQSHIAEKIKILRHKIADKILDNTDPQTAGIAIALMVGIKDYINYELMDNIRNSGLAHLLAISGIHITLATAIFFISFRTILSFNQKLTLNHNIKKISAIVAIIAGFFYLVLSGNPISAIRSFIMTSLILIAILIDQKPHPLRSICLAALLILIFSPDAILSISFQLSFAAIISLICFYQNFQQINQPKSIILKFIFYFFTIIISSLIASIATAPFIIYHFNNYAAYSILSNLIAIPVTTLLVMPLGFLSLFFMIFGIEKLALYPMELAINIIIDIANYVSQIPGSSHMISLISTTSLSLIIIGTLWILLWQTKWRLLGMIMIFIGIVTAYKTPLPNLLIDGNAKFFAIYDQEKGLIFSKKIRNSSKRRSWMKKMGEEQFKTLKNSDIEGVSCNKENCQLEINSHKITILTNRNKTNFICQDKSQILVNITKYQLPKCIKNKIIIDNIDLYTKGGHFLFLNKNKEPKIKPINGNSLIKK